MKMTTLKPGKGYPDNLATIIVEGEMYIRAFVCPNGRSEGGKTVAEIRAENPGKRVSVLPLVKAAEIVSAARDAAYIKPWAQIEADAWHEALNVLPPEKWRNVRGVEIFRMMEYTTGDITAHYARVEINGTDYYFAGSFKTSGPSYEEHAAAVYTAARLFIGSYPAGVVFADRARSKGGDYARLAFMPYDTLRLEVKPDCPPELEAMIRDWCNTHMQPGASYQVAQYTITLGTKA